jgi:hypothetical protein
MIARRFLHGSWRHSHEEDTEDALVYRRDGFAFPPSRGRDGFELHPDGTGAQHAVAPTDGNRATPVTWTVGSDDTVILTDAPSKLLRRMRIASVGKTRLVIRR